MRKTLIATTALAAAGALAAGSASAADMLSVGVGGYMQQWLGVSSVEDTANPATEGGIAQQSDSELFFRGKLEADNGLTVSVKIEIEGNTHASPVDESQLTLGGEFGAITLGAEDGASVLTHHGVRDAGFGMICGDFGSWINGIKGCGPGGMGTAGHGLGDKNNVTYFSPRVNGVQFGATYIPNIGQEAQTAPLANNDADAWSVGGNYKGDFGGANVAASVGYYERSTDYNYTNFGLQVGMGAFNFDVAYAVSDNGANDGANTDAVAAGAMYTDGPMAVSLSHTATEADDGDEQSGTLLSMSYSLAPGVAWRSSLFAAERDRGSTAMKDVPSMAGDMNRGTKVSIAGTSVEGNGFVTGITVGF